MHENTIKPERSKEVNRQRNSECFKDYALQLHIRSYTWNGFYSIWTTYTHRFSIFLYMEYNLKWQLYVYINSSCNTFVFLLVRTRYNLVIIINFILFYLWLSGKCVKNWNRWSLYYLFSVHLKWFSALIELWIVIDKANY